MEMVVAAFSAEHMAQITGLTLRQLAYWEQSGFFRPSYEQFEVGVRPLKVYSFNDAVGLRVIAVLRLQYKISVQNLRKVAKELASYTVTPWSSLKLVVCKGEVGVHDPSTGKARGVFSGQYILVPIIDQVRHVKREAAALNRRLPGQVGALEKHRRVAHNARVFAGTRVPVRAVERFLDAGYSSAAILKEYPSLERADIDLIERERSKRAA